MIEHVCYSQHFTATKKSAQCLKPVFKKVLLCDLDFRTLLLLLEKQFIPSPFTYL